jgi:hypothetical protein
MTNEIILTKETKILLIEVLKRGILTRSEAMEITKPFELILTKEQIDRAIDKL